MGFFWQSIPDYLLDWGAAELGHSAAFIETGTYLGTTAEAASRRFAQVSTVELDPTLARSAQLRFQGTNVSCVQGDSREALAELLPSRQATFIWLDAHYSGGITAGESDPCPLLSELRLIMEHRDPRNTILAIDDMRGFTGISGYPRLDEVVRLLRDGWSWNCVDDVLVATNNDMLERLTETSPSWRVRQLSAIYTYWPTLLTIYGTRRRAGESLRRLNDLFRHSE